MKIEWEGEKDEWLKENRKISFEQVRAEIEAGRNTEPKINPAHPHQFYTIVKLDEYPVFVPFVVMENGGWFLKTAYKSRKYKGDEK